ncbi:hypothetical protein JRG42_19295 [Pseudomonas granadensis]|jgi:hypothetical protein|uniref:Lipoprotein n=1 Tax=Pseudomonas granadensis TaxID=1421430 RepID=A0ABX7GN12_9PSED|nr:hypothetical protein [Pseudomonas granadensis]MBN6772747.1 hypothetical protein [Pseudomonas granadensis]MBN6806313.1 hypothetical protein [Pseudomonas granadensis]MBN6830892.1 hypothetical protein [Pseudomonas granadensis]MBN6840826.1 hypothetical protein [Pseudomonas granadensis]MBN6867796.1 hypothetical protein [Pseudomonas granadensis]
MKQATTMLLTVTAALLLGGCVADFDDDHRHGRHYDRDHGRYYDHDRRWDDRDDDRRDGRRYYRDRDDD